MIFWLISHKKRREIYTIYRVIHMKISRVNEPKIVCPISHEKSGKNARFFMRFYMNSRVKFFFQFCN